MHGTKKNPPKSFSGFRVRLAAAMRKAGIDPAICTEVGDVGYEGGDIACTVFRHWEDFRSNYEGEKDRYDTPEDWKLDAEAPVHDCVIDLVCDHWPAGREKCVHYAETTLKHFLGE